MTIKTKKPIAASTLSRARDILRKHKSVDFTNRVELDDAIQAQPHPSMGSIVLDHLIGGGHFDNHFYKGDLRCPVSPQGGNIIEIFGDAEPAKTTLALEAAVQVQKAGGTVLFLDYGSAFLPVYAKEIGVSFNEDQWDLYCPATWEEGAEILKVMIQVGVDMVIVDSKSAEGLFSGPQSDFLPTIAADLRQSGTSLVYLTGTDEDTCALKFYAHLRIKLRKFLTERGEKQPSCNLIHAECIKNKVSRHQGYKIDFALRCGEGIDNPRPLIDICATRGFIHKADSWYIYTDPHGQEFREQSVGKFRNLLINKKAITKPMIKIIYANSQ